MEPTIEKAVDTLVEAVENFASRTKPGVRDILVSDEVRRVQEKWRVDDIDALDPKYLERLRAKKEAAYGEEIRTIDKEIAPQFKPLREAISQKFADARRLRLESERIDPATNPSGFVNARLLDEFAGARAERFLSENKTNPQAILDRYSRSEGAERRDLHFVVLVDQAYGRTDEAPGDEAAHTFPLARAVRARQDSRIPPSLRTAHDKLEAAEATYVQARMMAFPSDATMTKAIGGMLKRAK